MSDERLAEAVRALREETAERLAPEELTRARIMSSVRERRRRRAAWVTVVVPLAAALAVGTALATVSGGFDQAWQRLTGAEEREASELPSAAASVGSPAVGAEPNVVETPAPEASAEQEPGDETVEPAGPAESGPRLPKVDAVADAAPRVPAVDRDPQDVYRVAHRAHFEHRDYAAALRGYERYLEAAPSGRFALEASYNRALCLARLGRSREAARALQPFAEGRFGGYRQREASSLIEALRGAQDAGGGT